MFLICFGHIGVGSHDTYSLVIDEKKIKYQHRIMESSILIVYNKLK